MSIPNDSAKSKPKKVVPIYWPVNRAKPEHNKFPLLAGLDIPHPPVDDHGRSHKYQPHEVADWVRSLGILGQNPPVIEFKKHKGDGSLYVWTRKTGKYNKGGSRFLTQLAMWYWEKIGRPEKASPRGVSHVIFIITSQVGELMDSSDIIGGKIPRQLNVKNGIIKLDEIGLGTQILCSHTPELISTYQLPVEYNPDIRECPEIDKFVGEITFPSTEYAELLFDVITLCIMPNPNNHKIIFLLGGGNNGKSTLIHLLEAFLGIENCSTASPHGLSERFGREDLVGKLVNLCGDIDQRALKHTGILKSISGGDSVPIEGKGKGIYSHRLDCRLIFTGMDIPPSDDVTDGLYRRFCGIPLPNKFLDDGGKTLARITTQSELSGLLYKVIHRFSRVHGNNGLRIPASNTKILTRHRRQADSVGEFVREMVESTGSIENFITSSDVFDMYVDWCEGRDDTTAKGKNEFYQIFWARLHSTFVNADIIKGRKRISGENPQWVYKGIRWKEYNIPTSIR